MECLGAYFSFTHAQACDNVGVQSDCPFMVPFEPADMSNQEKKNFQIEPGRKNLQTEGKQNRRRRKHWERLKPVLEVYFSSGKITSLITVYLHWGLMRVFIGAS